VQNIGVGSWGEDIKRLQEILNSLGYDLKTDGIFGMKTRDAVEDFQNTHADETGAPLMVDGIVGPRTWWAITHTDGSLAATTTSASNKTLLLALAVVVGGYLLFKKS